MALGQPLKMPHTHRAGTPLPLSHVGRWFLGRIDFVRSSLLTPH